MGHAKEDSKRTDTKMENSIFKKVAGKSDLMEWFGGARPFISQLFMWDSMTIP